MSESSLFRQRIKSISETFVFILTVLAIVLPIRFFVAQPFRVSGDSMVPTFHNHDYLIVDELSYRFSDPKRGDVIVLRQPESKRFLIKRIIGLPGETIVFTGNQVIIKNDTHPEGTVLDESYISLAVNENSTHNLSDDEYFVMGDNRPYSSDSRAWGPLDEDYIVGRAFLRLWPFGDISVNPGQHRHATDQATSEQ